MLAIVLSLGLGQLGVTPAALAADAPGSLAGVVSAPTGGVANAEVKVSGEGRSDVRRTGSDGAYAFKALPPGKYTVNVTPPAGFKLAGSAGISVTVQSRKATEGVNFALAAVAEPTATPIPSTPTPAASSLTADSRSMAQSEATPVRPVAGPGTAALFAPGARSSPAPLADVAPTATAAPESTDQATEQTNAEAAAATPSPAASPSARARRARSAEATATPEATEPSAAPLPTPASPDDILAGRGLHWRPTGIAPILANLPTPIATPQPTAVPTPDAAQAATQPRRVVTSLEAVGLAAASEVRSWTNATSLWLGVPFKTQIDGSEFAMVNCGPASLSMALGAFGLQVDPATLRDYVNHLTGDYSRDNGTSLDVLARIAREAGLNTFGLYGGGGYRAWTVEEIREHIRAGHPVITLAKYRSLPGNGRSLAEFDHYVVITGLSGTDFIYNDAAFGSTYGFNLLISPEDLERAWSFSSIPRHAVAIGLGDSLHPLPNVPSSLTAEHLALGPEAIRGPAEVPVAMIPGAAAQWLRERLLADMGAGAGGAERVEASGPPIEITTVMEAATSTFEANRDRAAAETSETAAPSVSAPAAESAAVAAPTSSGEITAAAVPVEAAAAPSSSVEPSAGVVAASAPAPATYPLAVGMVLLLIAGMTIRRHLPLSADR